MLLFGVLMAVMAILAVITTKQNEKVRTQEKIADSITLGANELNYLADDYLIYRESQQLVRWQTRFALFSAEAARLKVDTSDQQALVRNIQLNTERLKKVFDGVVTDIENSRKVRNAAYNPIFLQTSWSRITIQNQGMVSDASHLAQLLRQEMARIANKRTMLLYTMVGVLGLFLLASYMLIHRRIITATNKNLAEKMREGKFREDLFHRINIMPIEIPPLRERTDDIPLLAGHFLKSFNEHLGRKVAGFSKAAMDMMLKYYWPGNVRELRNSVEHALITVHGELVRPEHLGLKFDSKKEGKKTDAYEYNLKFLKDEMSLDAIIDEVLRVTLERCDGNKSKAAEFLKVNRKMFYR